MRGMHGGPDHFMVAAKTWVKEKCESRRNGKKGKGRKAQASEKLLDSVHRRCIGGKWRKYLEEKEHR